MTPLDQQILHDPENGQYGDCMRACVASILDLKSEEVPHFYESGTDEEFDKSLIEYLASKNLVEMCVNWQNPEDQHKAFRKVTGIYHLIAGPTERGTTHSVVGLDGEMVHDPHPSRVGLLSVDYFSFLVRKF